MRKTKLLKKCNNKSLNIKNVKGITLIALVITIIVILILAGVSINTLFGDNGLLTKAQEAADANTRAGAYDKVATEVLASYDNSGNLDATTLKSNIEAHTGGTAELGKNNGFPLTAVVDGYTFTINSDGDIVKGKVVIWAQKGTTITGSDGTVVNVGDTITGYNPKIGNNGQDLSEQKVTSFSNDNGYSSNDQTFSLSNAPTGWIILGADEKSGQLIIMPKDIVQADTNDGYFYLYGAKGYAKGIGELNKISKLYGQGKYADTAKTRSIKVEDINKVTGYNPIEDPYNSGEIDEYGSEVEYSWDNTDGKKVKYDNKTVPNKTDISDYEIFQYPKDDGTTENLKDDETKSFTSTNYYYSGSSISDELYKKLYYGILGPFWLGSQADQTEEGLVDFALRIIDSKGNVSGSSLFDSTGYAASVGRGVRPAVYLQSNIKLTEAESSDGWEVSACNDA